VLFRSAWDIWDGLTSLTEYFNLLRNKASGVRAFIITFAYLQPSRSESGRPVGSQAFQFIPAMIGLVQLLFQGLQPVVGRLHFVRIVAYIEFRGI